MSNKLRLTAVSVLLLALTVFLVASASGNLAGSKFESNDGNLLVGTAGNEDWANAPNRTQQSDLVKSTSDDAFGQGTKEDNAAVSVVTGSVPPNKSDLSEFYTSHEAVGGQTFMYLAWERTNVLGSANMDFEVNQATTSYPASGAVTINRTAGDLLFTYDFGGSGDPVLGMLVWATSGTAPAPPSGQSANTCFSSNTFPCWSDRVDLSAAHFAEGQINTSTVSDPILGTSLPGDTFGEMGINLSLALPNVFGANPTTCESLGSAYLKTRSSTSFTAEVKDFIRPVAIHVSNCGSLLLKKTASDTSAGQAGATFTAVKGSTDASGVTAASSNFVDEGNGFYCIDNMLLGQSTVVTETAAPANYDIASNSPQTVTVSSADNCATRLAASPPVPDTGLTFVDTPKLGAILITKTAKNHSAGSAQPLNGAVFNIFTGASSSTGQKGGDLTTSGSGTTCIGSLPFGTYTVHEKSAPSGYAKAADQNVTVSANGTCSTGTQAPVSVEDTPLTTLLVSATGQASGATASTIACKKGADTIGTDVSSPVDPASETVADLAPGTYTCTVVIDP